MGSGNRGTGATVIVLALGLGACGGGDDAAAPAQSAATNPLDLQLRTLIANARLTGDAAAGRTVPSIDTPLAQLGMRLFFSKSLSGNFDVACASCHHPALAGGDGLSLPVGAGAVEPALTGPGRATASGAPDVPRHSPTTFNVALLDTALFHDGRVESLAPQPGANGAAGAIRTPDVSFGQPDPAAGRFGPAAGNNELRARLAQRIGGYGDGAADLARNDWLPLFQAAFGAAAPAATLVTFDNIVAAIAEYERSQVFTDTPWRSYVSGDDAALSDAAKRGALLFLRLPGQGGAGCAGCHRGDRFTDETFHTLGFPQIGPGKGDGTDGSDDFGRGREDTADARVLRAFRVAPLLNVALTAPYGHAGAYATLAEVVRHYDDPAGTADAFFAGGGWCRLAQFAALPAADCAALYPHAQDNTDAAVAKALQDRAVGGGPPAINLRGTDVTDLVAFLEALTDRCAADAGCIRQWVPPDDGGPDDQQLRAVGAGGAPL